MPDRSAFFAHAVDQLGAAFRDFAPMLRSFYDGLLEQGFTPEQALYLTNGALQAFIWKGQELGADRKRDEL